MRILCGGGMSNSGTLTRADLSDAIHDGIGLSRSECYALTDSILEHVAAALTKGEQVKISGFGTFIVRDKGPRIGRNPKTGESVPIPARRSLSFRASQKMRDLIAKAG
jgi:integration host factor subunit alpha